MSQVLALAPLGRAWGNQITAVRITSHLEQAGLDVVLKDPSDIPPEGIHHQQYCAIVAFHAFRAGRHLPDDCNAVLILGGTDANESWDEETEQLMVRAVALASATIAFNQQLADAALLKWPEVRDRLWVIAPSVVVPSPAVGFCAREELGLAPEVVLLVLVAGIRQVKDPLFAVEGLEVLQAHQLHPGARLLIVGPSRDDDEYVHKFQSVIAENPFVHYWQPIDQDKLMAVLQQATAVLNTSLSEGASNAILEAMSLRTPVLARDIPGNAALIEHGVTGLLFKTPAGLAECFELLMTSDRECMAASAQRFFLENHSLDREAREYTRLVRSAIAGFPEANGAVS